MTGFSDEEIMENNLRHLKPGSGGLLVSAEHYRWLCSRLKQLRQFAQDVERDPLNAKYTAARRVLGSAVE